MGVKNSLTPQAVHRLLKAENFPPYSSPSPEHIREIVNYGAIVASTIHHFDNLDRGMDKARQLIDDYEESRRSFPSGMVIIADSMRKSAGRFGRDWHAPAGGIWLALIMVNTLIPKISRMYPLAAGIACCEFVRDYDINARLKWVNDVQVKGKKMAGILTETHIGQNSREEYIIIGLGINVNNRRFPPELENEAVAMRQLLGRKINLSTATPRLLARLAWNMGLLCFDEKKILTSYDKNKDQKLFVPARWRQLSDSLGRRVKFGFNVRENPQYKATILDIDNYGGLELLLADGSRITEYGGEIIYLD